MAKNHDALRKQARQLENEIDMKLVAFGKIGANSSHSSNTDTSPLLGESIFGSLSTEIEQKLDKLASINEVMAESSCSSAGTSTAAMHILQRHREILLGYRQEFNKISANHTARIEREELFRGPENISKISGLNRRDMYMKESNHLNSSNALINDQINIAIETRENLLSQRHAFKRLQTRFNDISNRFPLISSLIQRINIKKKRDALIVGAVVGLCVVLLLLYAFD
uniref:Golgi SNAP receptor complex member 1 n=1 Tax=Glossina morsitans morsitans TaxID=37546 RepID=D3TQT7_GLOMM